MRSVSRRGVTLLLALAACGGGSDTPASDAFCRDLRSGLTVMNIYQGVKDRYDSPAEFADVAYGHAKIGCADQLTTNEGLRTFLEAWGINPDA